MTKKNKTDAKKTDRNKKNIYDGQLFLNFVPDPDTINCDSMSNKEAKVIFFDPDREVIKKILNRRMD